MAKHASVRRPIVAGNWKMNLDHVEAIHLVQSLALRLRSIDHSGVEVAIYPPFTDLRSVEGLIGADNLPIELGAQHCSEHDAGAFTGEVSVPMLARLGVTRVLVGHSERRQFYAMTDELVAATIAVVLKHGLHPVICVGETGEERDAGATEEVLARQLTAALEGLPKGTEDDAVVAYEPVWAIGTGRAATPDDAQQACAFIRSTIATERGDVATQMRILYGGSAKADNAADLVSQIDVDGLLVGGASLDAEAFAAIIDATATCYGSTAT